MAGDHKETAREQSYDRLLENRTISWEMLARFYGNAETNRGPGAVFELIRDYNGAVSKTLEDYISDTDSTDFNYQDLSRALPVLRHYMLKWKIVTMTLRPGNVVFKKNRASGGTLVIIDNIGNTDFIPICNYVDFIALRKIRRKWQRFEDILAKRYPQNQALQQVLGNLKYA